MKITVTRSGGFAGIVEDLLEVDTDELDESVAEEVQQLVSKAGLFSLPDFVSGGHRHRSFRGAENGGDAGGHAVERAAGWGRFKRSMQRSPRTDSQPFDTR